MKPRLLQPLFSAQMKRAKDDGTLYTLVRAYDCIWTLLYRPEDISLEDRRSNALANLEALGSVIENALGPEVFDADPRQLSFPEEILDPAQPTILECETGLIQLGHKLD